MRRKLKRHYRQLTKAPPGKRFSRYRQNLGLNEHKWLRIVYFLAGVALIVVGVTFSLLPTLPGFVFTLAGIGIIAARSAPVARTLDRTELALRRCVQAIASRVRKRRVFSIDRDRR